MPDIIKKINELKDRFREAHDGMSPMKLHLDAADTKAMDEYQATVDRFPVKILAMTITRDAPETKVS